MKTSHWIKSNLSNSTGSQFRESPQQDILDHIALGVTQFYDLVTCLSVTTLGFLEKITANDI